MEDLQYSSAVSTPQHSKNTSLYPHHSKKCLSPLHTILQSQSHNFLTLTDVDLTSKFAQLEFKYGEVEKGKSLFESLITSYPKRTDLWSVYIDMLTKAGDIDSVRYVYMSGYETVGIRFTFRRI